MRECANKRRLLQQAILEDVLRSFVPVTDVMFAVVHEITALDPAVSNEAAILSLVDSVETFYVGKPGQCCTALCLLALRSNNRTAQQTALETLDLWVHDEKEPLQRTVALRMKGLAAFCFDDASAAIEATEAALDVVRTAGLGRLPT